MKSKIMHALAKHAEEMHFGKNWTWSFLKQHLEDVTLAEATTKIGTCNTILTLTYHINYYIDTNIKVFKGGPLEGTDKESFNHPMIESDEQWQQLLNKIWDQGKEFAALIEEMPEERLWETFVDEKYGDYFRNIQGIVEHTHYHLGQIVILKKLIRERKL